MYDKRTSFKYLIRKISELMPIKCSICERSLFKNFDDIILCNYHEGPIHLSCCINNCSEDKRPCLHSHGEYEKIPEVMISLGRY